MGILSFLSPITVALKPLAGAAKFIGERVLPPKKMSEIEKASEYAQLMGLSEASTDSARKLFMTELATQKQPWLIRLLNGLVRPLGGLGALLTEFYVIWGENLAEWFSHVHKPISLDTSQHLVLGTIIAFYFGSRLKETLTGHSTKR